MSKKILFLVHGFFIKTSLSHFLNVDSSLDPSTINQNQIFINRKERFIKFDTNGNELEVRKFLSFSFFFLTSYNEFLFSRYIIKREKTSLKPNFAQ